MQSAASGLHSTDDELLHAFEALTLDPTQFTHRRHLSFGWRYLQRYGFPEGAVKFRERLAAYVEHVGAAAKYHETITWGYLVLMNEEMTLRSASGESFDDMAARRPDLLDHRSGALSRCYPKAQLDEPNARRVFMLPRMPA
ncbi:MAG: hypothetical protein ACREV5_00405 [Steroidobacter sp.]